MVDAVPSRSLILHHKSSSRCKGGKEMRRRLGLAALLHFACAALLLSAVCGFQICTLPASFNTRIFATAKANTNDNNNANIDVDGKEGIIRAMEDARKSQNSGLSPGAQMVSAKIEYLATQRRIYLPTSRNFTSSSLFLYRFYRFLLFIHFYPPVECR